jgi:hypothetical protein
LILRTLSKFQGIRRQGEARRPIPYHIEGKEALRKRAEGERILKEEVMPELERAIDLGFSTDYIVQGIWNKVLKAIGRAKWL